MEDIAAKAEGYEKIENEEIDDEKVVNEQGKDEQADAENPADEQINEEQKNEENVEEDSDGASPKRTDKDFLFEKPGKGSILLDSQGNVVQCGGNVVDLSGSKSEADPEAPIIKDVNPGSGRWGSTLFECTKDVPTCLCGTFCTLCLTGRIAKRLGSLCNDCLTVACCGPCAACQLSREVDRCGLNPDKECW